MPEYRIGLDGLTINRSLDLVLDFPDEKSVRARKLALRSYYHALHQLVSAALFADRLVFDREIVPGSVLQDRASDFMQRLDMAGSQSEPFIVFDKPPDPFQLLSKSDSLERIRGALVALGTAVRGVHSRLWHDYIVRDCGNYLGSDRCLLRSDLPPAEYIFANGTRDFFVNPETDEIVRPLLDEIPAVAARELVSWCKPVAMDATTEALDEFCRRSVFAHVLVGENVAEHLDNRRSEVSPGSEPDENDAADTGFSDVWTCDTRQTLQALTPVRPGSAMEEGLADRKMITAVVPYAVEAVLRHVSILDPVESMVEGIAQVRELVEFEEVRRFLLTYRRTKSYEAAEDLRKITEEINRRTNLSRPDSLHMSFPSPLGVLPKTSFDVLRPTGRWTGSKLPRQVRARWVGAYIAVSGRKDEIEASVLAHLRRVFPNTFQ